MPIIGLILTFLANRLGVQLALAVTIITIVAGIYGVYVLAIQLALDSLTVDRSTYTAKALQALPEQTETLIAVILAARTAKLIFRLKLAAIRWYIQPQKVLF